MDEVGHVPAGTTEELQAELALLADMDRELDATPDLTLVAGVLLDYGLRLVGGEAGFVTFEDGERGISLTVKRGNSAILGALDAQMVEQLLAPEHEEGESTRAQAGYASSVLAVPLRFQQRPAGHVVLARSGATPFTTAEVARAQRLVRHASAAMGNALLFRELAATNEAKLRFVSKISHELKTPLAAIQGYSELIHSGLTGEITPKQRKFLAAIKRNIARSTTYIQNLTDFTRLEAGRLELVIEPRDFRQIIDEAVSAIRDEYHEKETQLHLDVPAALPSVYGDDFRLIEVLTNLLANACYYSPPGADVVLTASDRVPEAARVAADNVPAGPLLYCAVRDNGYGISEADQSHLFTPFFRSDAAAIRQTPGGGLGLALGRGIVALHGGALWYESVLGEGSTFHLVVPQAQS
jgi:signal transduction histidine kinase